MRWNDLFICLIVISLAILPDASSFVLTAAPVHSRQFLTTARTTRASSRLSTPSSDYNHVNTTQQDTRKEIDLSQYYKTPPDPLLNANDDSFRRFRTTVPLPFQYFLRDSGLLRFLVNSLVLLAIPSLLQNYPTAWNDLQTLLSRKNTSFQRVQYGTHRSQIMDMIRTQQSQKWIAFVHGGAWGSGFPLLYRLVANVGFNVAIIGYRTYPDTNVDGQIQDVAQATERLRQQEEGYIDMTLIGHSSGAPYWYARYLAIQDSAYPTICGDLGSLRYSETLSIRVQAGSGTHFSARTGVWW